MRIGFAQKLFAGRIKKINQNPLVEPHKYGQSFWLNNINRPLITSGELKRLVEEDGLRGVSSNPTVFEKVITEACISKRRASSVKTESSESSNSNSTKRKKLVCLNRRTFFVRLSKIANSRLKARQSEAFSICKNNKQTKSNDFARQKYKKRD